MRGWQWEDSSKDPGPRFDRADEQERARSRRLLLIVGLMVGPSVGVAIVFLHERAEVIEGDKLLEGGSMRSGLLSAGIVILAGLLFDLGRDWVISWFQ